jgi:hypothetical protein
MLRQAEININFKQEKYLEPVLLQTGVEDSALRYFAPVITASNGEFLVYVAENSKLCDLVRLKRELIIDADFGHACFSAELRLAEISAPNASLCPLALTIIAPRPESMSDEKCCFLT